jgi:hypothetical protein
MELEVSTWETSRKTDGLNWSSANSDRARVKLISADAAPSV